MPKQASTPSPSSTLPLNSAFDSPPLRNSQTHGDAQNPGINARDVAYRKQNTGFNLKNLPPRQVMSRCLVSFFRGYGVFFFFLPDIHTMSLYRAAYSPEEDELSPIGATPNMSSAKFSLLLLTAAVGALYAEDCDMPVKHIRQELFAVGIYHLDVAVRSIQDRSVATGVGNGGDGRTSDILTITALATAALYMMFEKDIFARKYIGTPNLDAFYLHIYRLPYSTYYIHAFIYFVLLPACS